jgi:uncharacterized membrane protein HdeD (DUF308 family)
MLIWRITSLLVALGCLFMVTLGIWAYENMPLHFSKPPGENAKQIYNQFYLVPYASMTLVLTIFSALGFSTLLRTWLSGICLGGASLCFFMVNSGVVGHDFGHVIYGGCFESAAMTNLIVSFNLVLLGYCGIVTFVSARELMYLRRDVA